ncbi:hypothetical protein SKAU_G00338710 [Synaphobranchus kaupii]|uniref:C-type lectin domain-containing protein n=1 Tax=Synaphobranchus kaupii TaxID=118154 RepID=A0A9Q1IIA7_SYNKA|nr:hypothetical protein SKAU_G00338710 [Synaphobranchus kaupii]
MKDSVAYAENNPEDIHIKPCSEDDNEFRHPPHHHSKTRHKVSMVRAENGPSTQIYKLSAAILGILCAVLMATIIGLCVSYKGLSEKHIFLSQNSSQENSNLKQLIGNYHQLTATLMKVQTNFQEAVSIKDAMQRERDRDRLEKEHLQRQKEALVNEEEKLQSRITVLEKNCERCPVGWELLHSCYFFSPTETGQKLSWHRSREECKKSGADLAVIDSQEKQEFISRILNGKRTSRESWFTAGYWIGLRDVETEGVWKWLNGTELTEGFWMEGEPNDQISKEDCAATFRKENPLMTWNDAPCDHNLKWICERKLQP